MGQLKAVAETFYKLKLEIEVMDQEVKFDTVHVSFKLTFDNKVTDRSNSGWDHLDSFRRTGTWQRNRNLYRDYPGYVSGMQAW